MKTSQYALSLKQPWAALVVAGLKSIEVRKWSTPRRGRILIHASKVMDERDEVWDRLPKELYDLAKNVGGIVGSADLIDCLTYRTSESFVADIPLHLNAAEWWQPPVLYGFVFANPQRGPYREFSGWMRFFEVPDE